MPAKAGQRTAVLRQETAALERAATQFVEWRRLFYDDGARVNLRMLADLRDAARGLHRTLESVLSGQEPGTCARLLVRMQEADGLHSGQSKYWDQLEQAQAIALLIDSACAVDVRPGIRGVKGDAYVAAWIMAAADEWGATGLRVSGHERSRFVRALLDFRHPEVPSVPGAAGIAAVLKGRKPTRALGG